MKEFKEIIHSNKEIKKIYQKRRKQQTIWNILGPILLLVLSCTIFGLFIMLFDKPLLFQFITPIILLVVGGLIIFRLDYNCSIQEEELQKINKYLLENAIVENRVVQILTLNDGHQIGKITINGDEMIVPKSLHEQPISILKYYKIKKNLEPEIKEEILRGTGL